MFIDVLTFCQCISLLLSPEARYTETHYGVWFIDRVKPLHLDTCFFCFFLFFFLVIVGYKHWPSCFWEMLWSPRLSLSNIHVRLTAKGLLRNIQLLSGCRKNTVVFQAGLSVTSLLNICTDIVFGSLCYYNDETPVRVCHVDLFCYRSCFYF